MTDNRVWIIPYSYHITTGTWHAEDDFEPKGYDKGWTNGEFVVVTYDREVALAAARATLVMPYGAALKIHELSIRETRINLMLLKQY